MSYEDGILAAEYMLQLAKEYVDGVGGDSHIVTMLSNGAIMDKVAWEVSEEENLLKALSKISHELILSSMATRVMNDEDFGKQMREAGKKILELRARKKLSDKKLDDLVDALQKWQEERENQKPQEMAPQSLEQTK